MKIPLNIHENSAEIFQETIHGEMEPWACHEISTLSLMGNIGFSWVYYWILLTSTYTTWIYLV